VSIEDPRPGGPTSAQSIVSGSNPVPRTVITVPPFSLARLAAPADVETELIDGAGT
jgi:hypothetical protein